MARPSKASGMEGSIMRDESGERTAPDESRTTELDTPVPRPHEKIGDYRVLRRLGAGGMGVVYEAEQSHPKRLVALKVVRGGAHIDEIHLKMFHREAQTLGRLKHPSIAAIYESGDTEDGQHFFAMELVRGETLSKWLQKRESAGGRSAVELRLRLEMFRRVCMRIFWGSASRAACCWRVVRRVWAWAPETTLVPRMPTCSTNAL